MSADEQILQLPHISLKSRTLLPEESGIYYVVDEKSIIWYIGKAKNLRTRWTGDSHHRLDQLQKQRKKQFTIYYELIPELQLDAIERQRIEQYNPQLNRTKVKAQNLHPTETLLRETLILIAPYSFVLAVESPRKEDPNLVEDSINWRDDWRVQKAVLSLGVIYVCINLNQLGEALKDNDWHSLCLFLRKVFRKRNNYSENWACKGTIKHEYLGIFYVRRLLVNAFAIEVYVTNKQTADLIQGYELTQLAGVKIQAVNEASLAVIKNKCQLRIAGMSMYSDNQNQPYDEYRRRVTERLFPYKEDLLKLFFNEDLDISKLQILPIEQNTKQESNTCLPTRLANLATKKEYLKALLTERGCDLNRYQVNKYLDLIPKTEKFIDSNNDRRMIVYVKSFMYPDLRKPTHYSTTINGNKGYLSQSQNLVDCPYKEVYLASTVDRSFWLLLEPYLSDFAK
ncbi:MAG TPA: hypothetical protein VIQ31_13665, partial [Phormidium sp.]